MNQDIDMWNGGYYHGTYPESKKPPSMGSLYTPAHIIP